MRRVAAREAAEKEALRGPAQVHEVFFGGAEGMFAFLETVDPVSYEDPDDDRSKGTLVPTIEHVERDGYVLAPYVDGALFASEQMHTQLYSHGRFGEAMYEYAWVDVGDVSLQVRVTQLAEDQAKAAQGGLIELLQYVREGYVDAWMGSEEQEVREVEFTFHGESMIGYETTGLSLAFADLEFIYDNKHITVIMLEDTSVFDYSVFERLTLEKHPINRE